MMQLGYYWAHHIKRNEWVIVKVSQGLHGAVLEGGYSVPLGEFDEIDPEPIVRRVGTMGQIVTMAGQEIAEIDVDGSVF